MDFPEDFAQIQLNAEFAAPQDDLTGKTAIVTGSNVGLGYETVAHLVRMNASRIIIAVRNLSKGEAAKEKLLAAAPAFKGTILVWELDMASFESVKKFAARVNSDLDKVDMAILNAGLATYSWRTTKDGWEETLQVNVIATGLLAALLLPKLDETAKLPGNDFQPHLEIVSSGAHTWAQFAEQDAPNSLEALNDKEKFNAGDRYYLSKLLDVFIAREIAQLPAAKNIHISYSNPGLCESEITREVPEEVKQSLKKLAWTGEKGSRNFVIAALSKAPSGVYISEGAPLEPGEFVRSEKGGKVQKKVWEELKTVWLQQSPELKDIVA